MLLLRWHGLLLLLGIVYPVQHHIVHCIADLLAFIIVLLSRVHLVLTRSLLLKLLLVERVRTSLHHLLRCKVAAVNDIAPVVVWSRLQLRRTNLNSST